MEAAGLGVGVVALVTLFETVVDCFEYIRSAKNFGIDFETSRHRLNNAHRRLSQWGQALGLREERPENTSIPTTWEPEKIADAKAQLEHINRLLHIATEDSSKFEVGGLSTHKKSSRFRKGFSIVTQRQRELTKKAQWALYEKEHLSSLIDDIHNLVNDFVSLFSAENQLRVTISVPPTTTATYTSREALSQELEGILSQAYAGRLAHAAAVIGLGGTGKTQLVLEYVEKHREKYKTILWLDVKSEEEARKSFERCSRALDLQTDSSARTVELTDTPAVQQVLQWLGSRTPEEQWLVVVDNADDLGWKVSSIVPHGQAGSVIVTSQDRMAPTVLLRNSGVVKVGAMESNEAKSLLRKAISKEENDDSENVSALLETLVNLLDRLPLAIDLAGVYIGAEVEYGENKDVAIRRYLIDLDHHRKSLCQNEQYACSTTYGKTVWSVWEASLSSIEQIENTEAEAFPLQLLMLMTTLNCTGIEEELFRLASLGIKETCELSCMTAPSWMHNILRLKDDGSWNDHGYKTAAKSLQRYGLVRPVKEPWNGFTMHSLVQWRAAYTGNREEIQRWGVLFIAAASHTYIQEWNRSPLREGHNASFLQNLTTHCPENARILANDRTSGRSEASGHDISWIWTAIGTVWEESGWWRKAGELYEAAYQSRLRTLGTGHLSTIESANGVANLLEKQGNYESAERMSRWVLRGMEKVQGKEHSDTLSSMNNLATKLERRQKYKEAEEIHRHVLKSRIKAVGEQHPDTLVSTNNLGLVLFRQRKYREAETIHLQVLECRVKLLGKEHPHTLTSLHNLATLYHEEQRFAEAEGLYRQAIGSQRKVLGENHPETTANKTNLALVVQKVGKYDEAEELYLQALDAQERMLGKEHPDTLQSVYNLGHVYYQKGNRAAALPLWVRTLASWIRTLGDSHPKTKECAGNVGVLGKELGILESRYGEMRVVVEVLPDGLTTTNVVSD